MVLVLIRDLVVPEESGRVGTFLIFKDSVGLIVDNKVKLCIQESLILPEVSEGGYDGTFSGFLRGICGPGFCPVVEGSEGYLQVGSILNPVGDLGLAWCEYKDACLALLHEPLDDSESCICLSSAGAVGEHVSLSVGMVVVVVTLVEELRLGSCDVFLLLREEEREGLTYVVDTADLDRDVLSLCLCLSFLPDGHCHLLA